MALFAPQFPNFNDPSYIGYSRQSSGDRSTATLISGLGNALVGAASTADEIIQTNIKDEIKGAVAGVDNNLLPEDVGLDKEAKDDTQAIDIFSEQKTQANVDVNQENNQAARLTRAFRSGKITPTYYWGQMSKISKELKTRYPGYGDIIDRQFQGLTGQIPANAFANAQRKEYTGYLSKINEEEKAFQSFVNKQWVQGNLPADYYERQLGGDPYTKAEIYDHVLKAERKDKEDQSEKARLSLAKSQKDLNKDEAVGAAIQRVQNISSTLLNSTFGKQVVDAINQGLQKSAGGVFATPEEKTALRSQFGLLKAQIKQRMISDLNAVDGNGESYNTLIDDPTKTKQILDTGMQEIGVLEDLLTNEDYGLFAATVNNIKAREQAYKNDVLSIPLYGYMDAIRGTGGSEIFEQLSWKSNFQKQISEANKAMLTILAAKKVAQEPMPLREQISSVAKNVTGGADQRAKVTRATIEQNIQALNNSSTTEGTRVTSAEDMFGEGNRNFLIHFNDNPDQQRNVYLKMVSPQVTASMSIVRETRPDLWDRYVDWAKESFMVVHAQQIGDVTEGLTEREDTNIQWNPKTNRFDFSLTERGKARRRKAQGTLFSLEDSLNSQVERAVNTLNEQISSLEEIINIEGGDVATELSNLLGAAGINSQVKKEPTIFTKMRDSLNNWLKEKNTKEKGSQSSP